MEKGYFGQKSQMEVFQVPKSETNDKRKNVCTKCGICGDKHFYRDCKYVMLTNKIKNKDILTKARLSLPDMLEVTKLADESSSVFTKYMVEVGTEFGPFIAKKNLTLNPFTTFSIKIFIENESDLSEYYLDTTDENECCWMMFVNPANDVEEQNLICFQEGEDIFFGCIRDINPGEELKVWYSPYYAFKMQKSTLSFKESSKLQVESEIHRSETDDLNILIKQQQKIVPRVVWNCKFCYKLEENVTDFARHLISHYSIHKRKTCIYCNQRFRYTQDYRKHVKLHHNDKLDVKDIPAKYLHGKTKVDDQSRSKSPVGLKNSTIGGPLLLQFLNDSLENSNSLVQQTEINSLDMENYENQNLLLDGENLRLNVDVIGNHSIKDLEDSSCDTKTKEFICDICLRKFATLKAISVHLKLHVGKYFCSSCKKVFGRSENLRQHRCNQIFSLKCHKCEKKFYQKKYLAKHISVVHDKKYSCTVCKKFYYSSAELRNHACGKVPKEKRRQFTCKFCLKNFSMEIYLKRHVKIHSAAKDREQTVKQICPECSYIFYSKLTYKRHLITAHSKSRAYDCHICDKKFSRKDILKSHMIDVHMLGPVKVNKCMQCNKEFKSKRSLDSHLKSTHNDSQYKCQCGVVFKYLRNLVRHKNRLHKNNTDILIEKDMHPCPICTTRVKLKRSLQRHVRQKHPEEYKNICIEINAKKEERKKLIRACPICHYEVKSVLSLKSHILKKHPREYRHIATDLHITKDAQEKQKKDVKIFEDDFDNYIDTDQKCMDLQKTIENMDFNIDTCNENLLSGSETIDNFLKESSEQISVLFTDSPKAPAVNDSGITVMTDRISNREVCLSMPDISEIDQEVKLKNVCVYCSRSYTSKGHLKRHGDCRPREKTCSSCGKQTNSEGALQRHLREKHPAPKRQAKTTAAAPMAKRSRLDHQDEPSTSPTQHCKICDLDVPTSRWAGHLRTWEHWEKSCVGQEEGIQLIKTSFRCRLASYRVDGIADPTNNRLLLRYLKAKTIRLVGKSLNQHDSIKIGMELFGRFLLQSKEEMEVKSFNTKFRILSGDTDLEEMFHPFAAILEKKESF